MKKLECIALTGALVMGLLAGCGSQPSNTESNSSGTAAVEDTETVAVEQEEQETESAEAPTIYFEGFMPWIGGAGKVASTDEALEKVQNYVIEQCGVKPVPVLLPSGSEQEKLNLLISDPSEQLDIIMMNPTWESWGRLAENGQIVPLNDLLDEYGQDIKEAFSGDLEWLLDPMTDEDGNIWALPRALETTSSPTYIRKDWLDQTGLDMPETFDELEEVLAAFKEADFAGNGQTIPLLVVNEGGFNYGITSGFTKYGYGYWMDEQDSLIKPAVLQPGFEECLERVNTWYEEGYMHPDSFTLAWSDFEDLFMADRVGVIIGSYGVTANNLANLQALDPEAEYVYADGIQGPQGFMETREKASNSGMMITAKSQNPEACMKLLNWVVADSSNFLTMMYGIEGEGWRWQDKEKGLYVILDTESYGGELYIYPNNYNLRQIGQVDEESGELRADSKFMMEDQYRYDTTKESFDKAVFWNAAAIDAINPNVSDVDKMISENVIKFITGQRDLAEWNTFVNDDLQKAGIDAYMEAYTTFYNENK